MEMHLLIFLRRMVRRRGLPGSHHKLFFPIEESETTGEIRQIPITDLGGDKLSPPFWRTASELLEPERHDLASTDAIFKSHQLALKTLEDFLGSR